MKCFCLNVISFQPLIVNSTESSSTAVICNVVSDWLLVDVILLRPYGLAIHIKSHINITPHRNKTFTVSLFLVKYGNIVHLQLSTSFFVVDMVDCHG